MLAKHHFSFIIIVVSLLAISVGYFLLPVSMSPPQKPEEAPLKIYDHYTIINEVDGHILMQVSVSVNVGDELLSEENNFYRIVKVEENRAYARFIGSLELEKFKRQLP